MNTIFIGQEKFIVRGARYYRMTEASEDAATQAEWAEKVLAAPAVICQNGRDSHIVAGDVLDRAEDTLLDHLVITA